MRLSAAVLALLWLCLAGTLCLACARSLPQRDSSAALYRDLQRIVTVAEAAEWKIDRLETADVMPDALFSVCQVDEQSRHELDAWLQHRIEELGGSPVEVYRKRGRKLRSVKELLELSRIQMVLRAADAASTSDCPFWLEPKSGFGGRQISDDRWQLTVGGGGRGNLVFQGDESDLSFGGAGRLLLGRAIGDRYSIYAGLESGGQASFPKDEEGNRQGVEVALEIAVPVVVRYRLVNSYLEIEGGYLVTFEEDSLDSAQGFRVGVSVGARALLTRRFFPGAAFQVIYDRIDGLGQPTLNVVRLGIRVAIDLNL